VALNSIHGKAIELLIGNDCIFEAKCAFNKRLFFDSDSCFECHSNKTQRKIYRYKPEATIYYNQVQHTLGESLMVLNMFVSFVDYAHSKQTQC
jgi:hypothetical protein